MTTILDVDLDFHLFDEVEHFLVVDFLEEADLYSLEVAEEIDPALDPYSLEVAEEIDPVQDYLVVSALESLLVVVVPIDFAKVVLEAFLVETDTVVVDLHYEDMEGYSLVLVPHTLVDIRHSSVVGIFVVDLVVLVAFVTGWDLVEHFRMVT
jgi:hypothetical protein